MPHPDESIVQIDDTRLDKECIKLPTDYIRAAYNAAEAKRDIAEADAELDVVKADVGKRIRETPGRYGLDPQSFRGGTITEAAIKEAMLKDKEVDAAAERVRDAQYKYDLASALVSAMEMKKRALTNLIELHAAGWYGQVRPSEAGKAAVGDMSRKAVQPQRRERDREWKKD